MPSLVPSGQQSGSKRQNLSGARLEKKRRAGRESQRAGRERTRNYILHLEKLVESLKQGQEDERLQTLTRKCQELRQQNERLITIFTSISRLARSADILDVNGNSLSDSISSPQRAASATTTESVADQQPPVDEAEVIGGVMPIISYSNPNSFWAPPCSSSRKNRAKRCKHQTLSHPARPRHCRMGTLRHRQIQYLCLVHRYWHRCWGTNKWEICQEHFPLMIIPRKSSVN
jgi:hypothetical protein